MADATLVLTPSVGGGVSMDVMGNSSTSGVYLKEGPDSIRLPVVAYEEEFADSPDTEGGQVVRSRPQRTQGGLDLWVNGKTTADMLTQFQSFEQTIEQCRRSKGRLTYTPKNGTPVTYNVETARISDLKQRDILMRAGRMECSVEFQFQPYGELTKIIGYPLSDIDPFNRDSIGNQEWRFDAGAGTVSVGGGSLIMGSTAIKTLYRAMNVIDATDTVKFNTGASVGATTIMRVSLKRLGANDYIFMNWDNTNGFRIYKMDGGVATSLAGPNAPTISANTSYWFQLNMTGNVITAKIFTTDPNGSTPTPAIANGTLSAPLTAGDATKFGAGVKGNPGFTIQPQATALWSVDDWRLDSSFIEAFDPQVNFEMLGVGGSVEALVQLNAQDMSNQARKHLEIGLDDRDYDKAQPQPTLIDSDMLQTAGLIGSPATHSGTGTAYDPGATTPNVIKATLSTTYQGICSTGSQFHTGDRKIKARVFPAGTGPVYVRLAFRTGDGGWTRKDWVACPNTGNFYEIDLGSILIPDAIVSGQSWEGVIEAYSSTNNDTLEIDFIEVLPARRWARAKAPSDIGVKSLLIQERFNQSLTNPFSGSAVGGGATQAISKTPATFADDATDGSVAFANPSFAANEDGLESIASSGIVAANYVYSHDLKSTMGASAFAIPGTATIKGIQVNVKRRVANNPWNTSGNQKAVDFRVQMQKAGSYVGSNYAAPSEDWPLGSSYKSYGGPNDLWGTTWTPAEVNAATFGVGVAGVSFVLNPGLGISQDWAIDYVFITVYYTDTGAAGNWQGDGSANDFSSTGGTAFQLARSAVSDASTGQGRFIQPGSGSFGSIGVAVTCYKPDSASGAGEFYRGGVILRHSGNLATGNLLFVGFDFDMTVTPQIQRLSVYKMNSGPPWLRLISATVYGSLAGGRRVWAEVDTAGNYFVWTGVPTQPTLVITGNDPVLSSVGPGALATGTVGIYDEKQGSVAVTRNYDDFEVWVPDFASGIIIPNGITAINEGSAFRQTGSDIGLDGSYLRLNPAGKEQRGSQWVVKARRNDVDLQPDDQISDLLRVSVDVTPRVALL